MSDTEQELLRADHDSTSSIEPHGFEQSTRNLSKVESRVRRIDRDAPGWLPSLELRAER